MIGNQSIVMSLPINEIQVTTEKDLDNQIKEAIGGDKEAAHIVQVRIDYSLKKPIVLVLKCLGVSDAVDCGTFGTPRSIDPLVYVLKNTFENVVNSHYYYVCITVKLYMARGRRESIIREGSASSSIWHRLKKY